MDEKNILTKYLATITMGDEYHPEGEAWYITSREVERTKEHGLRLEAYTDNWGDAHYHLYPCTIRKEVYRLDLNETQTIPGGDTGKIGYDITEREYNWQDHWC